VDLLNIWLSLVAVVVRQIILVVAVQVALELALLI